MTNLQEKPENSKRLFLSELSKQVAPLVEAGEYDRINAAIIATYKNETHQEFKRFSEWKKLGYQIKKGSEAFTVWARPRTKYKVENQVQTEEKDYSFFPLCFLFSNAQVEPRRAQTHE